jgi:stalled ribosome rescue protein Dom34
VAEFKLSSNVPHPRHSRAAGNRIMSKFVDAIVWIDRHQAKLFHFSATDDVKLVFMHTSAQRQHHRADHEDGTKHAVDVPFLQSIVRSLDHSGGILIAGPGNSKFELQRHIDQHRPDLAARISGVESLDNPADAGILELARRFYRSRGHRHPVELADARKNG